jgi:hypothetical protein
MRTMRDAIRETAGDTRHMLTVAHLPFGNSGFGPSDLADLEELAAIHVYPGPGADELEKAIGYVASAKPDGRPVVLDETGFYRGGDVAAFIVGTRNLARGWLGHYLELTPAEILAQPDAAPAEVMHLAFYRTFLRLTSIMNPSDGGIVQP